MYALFGLIVPRTSFTDSDHRFCFVRTFERIHSPTRFFEKWQSVSPKVGFAVVSGDRQAEDGTDETEMLEIPGIDPDKVERYGQRFLKLIRNAQRGYYEMKQQQHDLPRDPPEDPNHRTVINISSGDEFADGYDLDDFAGEDGSQEERSSYFHAPPEVDAFNARCEFCFYPLVEFTCSFN